MSDTNPVADGEPVMFNRETTDYFESIGADINNLTSIQVKACNYLNPPKAENTLIDISTTYSVANVIDDFKKMDNFDVKYLKNVRPVYSDVRVDCPLNEELAIECFKEAIPLMTSYERGINMAHIKYISSMYYKGQLQTLSSLKARDMTKLYNDKPEWVTKYELLEQEHNALKKSFDKLKNPISRIFNDELLFLRADKIPKTCPKWVMRHHENIADYMTQINNIMVTYKSEHEDIVIG